MNFNANITYDILESSFSLKANLELNIILPVVITIVRVL